MRRDHQRPCVREPHTGEEKIPPCSNVLKVDLGEYPRIFSIRHRSISSTRPAIQICHP